MTSNWTQPKSVLCTCRLQRCFQTLHPVLTLPVPSNLLKPAAMRPLRTRGTMRPVGRWGSRH